MRVKQFIHIKSVFGLVLALVFLIHSPGFAQTDTAAVNADTEQVSTESPDTEAESTIADDSETAPETTGSSEETVAAPTSQSTVADAAENAEAGIPAQVYVNFFYYVLLFVLVCLIVTIIGQIMSIYDLTQGLQKRRVGNNWHAHQGWFFLVGLFVFLYGMYWSYANHGAMSSVKRQPCMGLKSTPCLSLQQLLPPSYYFLRTLLFSDSHFNTGDLINVKHIITRTIIRWKWSGRSLQR